MSSDFFSISHKGSPTKSMILQQINPAQKTKSTLSPHSSMHSREAHAIDHTSQDILGKRVYIYYVVYILVCYGIQQQSLRICIFSLSLHFSNFLGHKILLFLHTLLIKSKSNRAAGGHILFCSESSCSLYILVVPLLLPIHLVVHICTSIVVASTYVRLINTQISVIMTVSSFRTQPKKGHLARSPTSLNTIHRVKMPHFEI